jgi:hypothetical protein
VYHKLANDKGALVVMCERDDEPKPSVATCFAMACACCRAMDTCC